MDDREFFIDSDGVRLHARIDLPNPATAKMPVLVLIHGYTGHMEERHIRAAAETAAREGFAVLRAELYGHGQSGGTFREHNIMIWVLETLTLIDYAAELDFCDGVWLAGHSQGGLTTILAAAMKRDVLRGVIPLAPATVIRDAARNGDLFGTPFDPDHIPPVLTMDDSRLLGGNYFRVAQTLPIEDALRAYKGPVLIVHADTDEAVPLACAQQAADAYADCELVIIHNDTHCYDNHLDQMTTALAAFLRRTRG